jgi:hypothetical protein
VGSSEAAKILKRESVREKRVRKGQGRRRRKDSQRAAEKKVGAIVNVASCST